MTQTQTETLTRASNSQDTAARSRPVRSSLRQLGIDEEELFDIDGVGVDIGSTAAHVLSPTSKALRRALAEGKAMQRKESVATKIQRWYERQMANLEPRYPMLAGHIDLFVGSLDLAIRSVRWFRFGFVAVWLGFRLILYSLVLLPAFLRICYAYFHDKRIIRRIRFGSEARNYLDIYCPKEALAAIEGKGPKVPVVIAVMGGAWVMGHRAWNAQLGLRLMDMGVLVCAVDYRNFPIGQIPEMIQDLSRAFGWVFANVEAFGGDSKNMMLIGQSAGAHLSSLLLLEHSLLEARPGSKPFNDRWSGKDLKGFLAVSGPFDFVELEPHLASRGIYSRILHHLCDGDLAGSSPSLIVQTEDWKEMASLAVKNLPPMHFYTGDADKTVPTWSSIDFAKHLRQSGHDKVKLEVVEGMTHTYPVIEGPMAGDDPQVERILPYLFGKERSSELMEASPGVRLFPQPFIDVASVIMPY
eukprot:TRINITY_DN17900_c1_g1_i1.p1 TRINITY_DN17900_c1_g1~~TRINITY_DN17900_c1_g1_i1.p1  ORF type:complete len:470 (+),score=68.01 TRINITY_DN17900_c1_g1_i1:53-1462(+)